MASSDCAPNQSFGLLRCSAWLILRQQSTGLFPPKRSCFRAAPLRRSVHRTVLSVTLDLQSCAPPIALKGKPCGGRGEQSVCAAQPPGPSLLSLSSALFSFLFLSFLLVYKSGKKGDSSWRKGRFAGNFREERRFFQEERGFFREERGLFREERAICGELPGGKEILPGRKRIISGGKGDLPGISVRNPVSPSAAASMQRKRKSRVCARRKPHRSLLSSAFLSISFSFFSFVAFVPDETRYVPDESRFVPDESRQSSLTPLRRKKMSTDAISIRMHTMITSSCLLPAPSRCRSSVMVTNWRPKVTPSSAPRLHIVE